LDLVRLAAKKDEVPVSTPSVCTVIEISKKCNFAASIFGTSGLTKTASGIAPSSLVDAAFSLLDILLDIQKDKRSRSEFNHNIIEQLRSRIGERGVIWICPRSKKPIHLSLKKNQISLDCPYILDRPPIGCKVTGKKVALAAVGFPPLVFLPLFKALYDFASLNIGISPFNTYGYCYIADHIIRQPFRLNEMDWG